MSTLTHRYAPTRRDSRALRDLKRRGPPLSDEQLLGDHCALWFALAVIAAVIAGVLS